MVKLVLMDLDGTLLTSGKTIAAEDYAAMEEAAARGVYLVPCTGRFFLGMPQVVRQLPFLRYAVTVNGGEVYDIQAGKALLREEIPWETADRVYARMEELPVIFDCFADGWGYMDRRLYDRIDDFISDPQTNAMVKELRRPVEGFRAVMAQKRQAAQKIQAFFADQALRLDAWEQLAREFPQLSVTSSIVNNVELTAQNAHKGYALGRLSALLGIPRDQTMAIGDGYNDKSMVEAAGIGVAMANACDELKAAADVITDSNDHFGVARVIRRFCLGE